MDLAQLRRLFGPTVRKINGLIVRGSIYLADDSGPVQTLQIGALATELRAKIERLQNYGFASNPPPGTEALFVCKNGERGNMVAIATDHRAMRRKNLLSGESAQYNGITGDFFQLFNTGIAVLKATTMIKLGGLGANDPVARLSDLAALAATFNAHVHLLPELELENAVPIAPEEPPEDPEEEPPAPIATGGFTGPPDMSQVATASNKVFIH